LKHKWIASIWESNSPTSNSTRPASTSTSSTNSKRQSRRFSLFRQFRSPHSPDLILSSPPQSSPTTSSSVVNSNESSHNNDLTNSLTSSAPNVQLATPKSKTAHKSNKSTTATSIRIPKESKKNPTERSKSPSSDESQPAVNNNGERSRSPTKARSKNTSSGKFSRLEVLNNNSPHDDDFIGRFNLSPRSSFEDESINTDSTSSLTGSGPTTKDKETLNTKENAKDGKEKKKVLTTVKGWFTDDIFSKNSKHKKLALKKKHPSPSSAEEQLHNEDELLPSNSDQSQAPLDKKVAKANYQNLKNAESRGEKIVSFNLTPKSQPVDSSQLSEQLTSHSDPDLALSARSEESSDSATKHGSSSPTSKLIKQLSQTFSSSPPKSCPSCQKTIEKLKEKKRQLQATLERERSVNEAMLVAQKASMKNVLTENQDLHKKMELMQLPMEKLRNSKGEINSELLVLYLVGLSDTENVSISVQDFKSLLASFIKFPNFSPPPSFQKQTSETSHSAETTHTNSHTNKKNTIEEDDEEDDDYDVDEPETAGNFSDTSSENHSKIETPS